MHNEYPDWADDKTCVACGDLIGTKVETPEVPYDPLVNGCCSWECYATKLKCDLRDMERESKMARDGYRRMLARYTKLEVK